MNDTANLCSNFDSLNLSSLVIDALSHHGYETPTPIQSEIIPYILQKRDVIGQAQTGTGKTAAFALPLLSNLNQDLKKNNNLKPKILVLAPTRELAIQVADSFRKYASKISNITITTICGGQDYRTQLKALKDGSDVVVGTPGRILDHINRGSLDITELTGVVLDEADEMLRMGFIEDIDLILEQTPSDKQTALFSATMPKAIKNIALKYLKNPLKIHIAPKDNTSKLISQSYWGVNYKDKLNTLVRILEINKYTPNTDATIIFSRTRQETIVICDKLLSLGYKAVALNGDIEQRKREKTIRDLKENKIDILIATDVAARGLDVDRITTVINYDMPHDVETYMHRIGRTGRAGREGTALSFVANSEYNLLDSIQRFTKLEIKKYSMPNLDEINQKRIEIFQNKLASVLEKAKNNPQKLAELEELSGIIDTISENTDYTNAEIAAALIKLLYKNSSLLLSKADILTSEPARTNQRSSSRGRSHSQSDRRSNRRFDRNSGRRSERRSSERNSGRRDERNSDNRFSRDSERGSERSSGRRGERKSDNRFSRDSERTSNRDSGRNSRNSDRYQDRNSTGRNSRRSDDRFENNSNKRSRKGKPNNRSY